MAEVYKVLAQLEVPAASLTDTYTVPAATSTVISSFTVTNRNAATRRFRLSIAVGGAADSVKQYLYYDQNVASNTTFAATLGITIATTDVIRIYGNNTGLSINIFGAEIT